LSGYYNTPLGYYETLPEYYEALPKHYKAIQGYYEAITGRFNAVSGNVFLQNNAPGGLRSAGKPYRSRRQAFCTKEQQL